MGYETRVVVVVPAFDISIRTFPNGHLNRLSESLLESPWKKESKEKDRGISFLASFPYTCLQMHCSKAGKLLCNEISEKETSNQFRKPDQKTKALHKEIESHDSFDVVTLTFPLFITMSFFLTAGKPYLKMKKPTSIIWSKKSTPTPPPSCTQ